MISFCTETGWQSINKYGEELCGDNVEIATPNENVTIAVLADGLGSGVKASILSTLTSKIISTMVAQEMPLQDCVEAIAATLPVCSVRQIAYSTFTIIKITNNHYAEIIQFDNPKVILLREGKHFEFSLSEQVIKGKTVYLSKLSVQEDDTFIAFSDGVEHAGVGQGLNFGWQRRDIIHFMERLYRKEYTAQMLAGVLLDQCKRLYENRPGDDATACVLKLRRRVAVSLLIGPPQNPADVDKMMDLFFSKMGLHIVCGGTTSSLAAKHLGESVEASLPSAKDNPDIPPVATVKGIDLVTEGVITISKVLDYSQQYLQGEYNYYEMRFRTDGASRIASMLFDEATDISFFVGKAINPAHQNPNLPINFTIKMRLVQELAKNLEKMGKRIKVSYF